MRWWGKPTSISAWCPFCGSTVLRPPPPIFQPWVVIRATTVVQSQDMTRMFASLVSTCNLAVRSRLKVFVQSSGEADGTGEADGKTDRNVTHIVSIIVSSMEAPPPQIHLNDSFSHATQPSDRPSLRSALSLD